MYDKQVLRLSSVASLDFNLTTFGKFKCVLNQIHQYLLKTPAITVELWNGALLVWTIFSCSINSISLESITEIISSLLLT